MSIRVSNLRLSLEEPELALPTHLAKVLGLPVTDIRHWRILRKSLDSRRRDRLQFVYTAEVSADPDAERALLEHAGTSGSAVRVEAHAETPFAMPAAGSEPLEQRPVVV